MKFYFKIIKKKTIILINNWGTKNNLQKRMNNRIEQNLN